jgi:hypothetical protein
MYRAETLLSPARKAGYLLLLLSGLALGTTRARAATCQVPSGASQAIIAATISACGSGNTVAFAAGTYQLSSTVYVPCGVSLTGPIVPWSNPSANTATINSKVGGGAAFRFDGCATPASVKYLNFNGGQPSPDGGQILYFPAGTSNMTVSHNYFHGNQGNPSNPSFIDGLVLFDGSSNSVVSSDDTITWNIFGGPNTNDCSNLMNNYKYPGLGGDGGYCVGLGLHNGFENLVVENNIFQYLEQGMKVFEHQGQCVNCVIEYNDFNHIHRINFETQANIGGSQPTSMLIRYNSIHDQYATNYGSWGFSSANGCLSGCVTNTDYNVLINNVQATNGGQYTPGAIEVWGSAGTTDSFNLIQGYWANGIMTSKTGQFVYNNNKICLAYGGSEEPPGKGGYFNDETSNPQIGKPSFTGNTVTASANCPQTSTTPIISPPSGSFTGSLTVTFDNPGTDINANTGIWYTTDGSTPVPGQGTAKYIASGGSIVIDTDTTINAVGMWGAENQPASYPPGFGYVPSPVVTAVYTTDGSSAPTPPPTPAPPAPAPPTPVPPTSKSAAPTTLESVVLKPEAGGATLEQGGSMQMVAHAIYQDGSTGILPDKYGNAVTAWNTSDHPVAKVSSEGKVTAIEAGSVNIEAMVGALRATPWALTVVAEPAPPVTKTEPTLQGGYLGNPGNVNTAEVGGPGIQFTAYAYYSDGAVRTLPDEFGNKPIWSSSDTKACKVSSNGFFKALTKGTCTVEVVTSPGGVRLNGWEMHP